MDDYGGVERRQYVAITEEDLKRLIAEASLAGAREAVDEFVALLGRKTLRNIGILLAAAVVVATSWMSGIVHINIGSK